jgi:hypothetical protein
MKPILRAYLSVCDSRRLTLDCGDNAAMRIVALTDDVVRVTLLRGGEVRQKRTWAVPAFVRLTRIGPAAPGSTTVRGQRSQL